MLFRSESEIFLNGTRLSKFMESVDQVTGAMGQPEAAQEVVQEVMQEMAHEVALSSVAAPDGGIGAPRAATVDSAAGEIAVNAADVETGGLLEAVADAAADVLADVPADLAAGASSPAATSTSSPIPDPWAPLLDAGLKFVESLAAAPGGSQAAWVETDATTGRSFVKLALPEPAALQRLAERLTGLITAIRRSPGA